MKFAPPRGLGMSIGGMLLLLLLGISALAISQLVASIFSPLTPLWILVPIVSLPLAGYVAYCLYGLGTAYYQLDRDSFTLAWGLAREQFPLADIASIKPAGDRVRGLWPTGGLTWPGFMVGARPVEGVGELEFFATRAGEQMLLLKAGTKNLAISPADTQAFMDAFGKMTRMGSLARVARQSYRPTFLHTRLWADRLARGLILAGLALPLGLLSYLALRAPSLPAEIPFGFDPAGVPSPMAPPARLLLLPLIGGICWLVDLLMGAWLYRDRQDRTLAYALWASALIVGGLLWGALLQLLALA